MFKFIFVPCTLTEPITTKEESKAGGLKDDYLVTTAKEYFFEKSGGAARVKALDEASPEKQKQIVQQIRNQYSSHENHAAREQVQKMDDEMLLNLFRANSSASCEIIALTLPTELNNYRGVSMYANDNAKTLELPINDRATALVKACGHQSNIIHGDVFVGRYNDNEIQDIWERVDFTEEDIQGDLETKEWIKTCKKKGGGGGVGGAASSLSGMMSGTSQTSNEDGYKWSQTDDEVEIKFSVAPGTKAKYCKVKFGRKSLKVTVAGQTLCDGETWGTVSIDESTYTIQDDPDSESGRELCISLGKHSNEHWNYAIMKK